VLILGFNSSSAKSIRRQESSTSHEQHQVTPHPPNANESATDQLPLPPWDRYLKAISKITLNDKNKQYRDYIRSLNKDNAAGPELIKLIEDAFEKMISDEDKNLLHHVKKKEIDAIRRRLIPKKKHMSDDSEMPTHLNMTYLRFTAHDLGLLIQANIEHAKKFRELRDNDFKAYEMEKRFLEEQRLRHMKTEEKRKEELERIEAEKARQAGVHVKHPMSEDAEKDVWENEEHLPKDEFNPKTFFALNDLDGNGLLDLEEVRMILRKELHSSNMTDIREQHEEIERMREHIYKEVDKNGDLMIDFEEFSMQIQKDEENKKNWETVGNEATFNETEFDEFEKQRIGEIRDDIAEGKKPRGYDYEDVPLFDDNFMNETHIRYDGVLMKVDDSPHDIREKHFKEYAMRKEFEEQEKLRHIEDPLKRRRMEIEREIEKKKKIKVHEPMSPDQLKATWEEQDHKNESDFDPVKFFNLHDIDRNSKIDHQELRMMIISELTDSYKSQNKSIDSEEFREDLEKIREDVLEKGDRDGDKFLNKEEFLSLVERNKENHKERAIHEESEFTEEEFNEYRDERVMEIRKMIAKGVLPPNYNYSDVPLLSGNFVNATHILRDGVLVDIHKQKDRKQRIKDFKRFKMQARFEYEHRMKDLSPEEREKEKARLKQLVEERKRMHKKMPAPMSEDQEKDVWEKDDKMDKEEFSLEKYFRLHDIDGSGKWNRQEVISSLMEELNKMYNISDPSLHEKRAAEMQSWLNYVFTTGDLNKDGEIDFSEVEYLNKRANDKKEKNEDEWKSIEDDDEYTEDEWEKFKHDQDTYDG